MVDKEGKKRKGDNDGEDGGGKERIKLGGLKTDDNYAGGLERGRM